MFLRDFYTTTISSEESCLRYLRFHGIIPEADDSYPCDKCKCIMKQCQRRDRSGSFRPALRCTNSKCRTYKSIRGPNKFFFYSDMNGRPGCKLTLSAILELVQMFLLDMPVLDLFNFDENFILFFRDDKILTKWMHGT